MRDYIEIVECMRYGVLTEERGRTDFLLNTYGAKLEARWLAGEAGEPAHIKTAVEAMPGNEIAQKLIGYFASFDPSQNGQYTQWMLLRYLKNNLRLQDLPQTKDYLTLFASMKAKKQLPTAQNDINTFQNFTDFVQGMKQHRSTRLPAKLENKWKAIQATEPDNVREAIAKAPGKTLGDKVLAYIATFDPSHGHHVYWLGVTWLTNGFRLEDLEAARDYLQEFDRLMAAGEIEGDIENIHTLADLGNLVRSDVEDQPLVGSSVEETKMLAQSKVMHDDDEVRVLEPLSKAAACYFGRNTEWCTAWGDHTELGLSHPGRYPSRTNQYDSYSRQGSLYIIEIKPELDKDGNEVKKGKIYQFHGESNSFANVNDKMLSKNRVKSLLKDYPQIKEAIGDPLADAEELYAKHGMTREVKNRIDSDLARGLDIGAYDETRKRFIVETWKSFEEFLSGISDDQVEKILEIVLGESDNQQIGTLDNEFTNALLAMPPTLQEKALDRAKLAGEISDSLLIQAAQKLMRDNDEWFAIFEEMYNSTSNLTDEAWERLKEYAEVGWVYVGHGVYDNIPDNPEEFEQFVMGKKTVELYVDEDDMLGYAMVGDDYDEEDYDEDYTYSVIRMKGDSGGSANWDQMDNDYMDEQRKEAGLIDNRDKDTWLSSLGDDASQSLLADDFISVLQGNKMKGRIKDPRQQELKFEGLRRLLMLAGILKG